MKKLHLILAAYSLTAAAVVRPAEPPQSVLMAVTGERETQNVSASANALQSILADSVLQNVLTADPTTPPQNTAVGRDGHNAYQAACNRAVAENKPVAVWIGFPCEPCQKNLAEFVHCNVDCPWNNFTQPCVLVGRKGPDGTLYQCGTVLVQNGVEFDSNRVRQLVTNNTAAGTVASSACGCVNCPAGGNCSYTGQCNQPQCFANGYTGFGGMTCGPNGCTMNYGGGYGGPQFFGGGCASGNCGGPAFGGGCAGGDCGSGGYGESGGGGGRRGFFGGGGHRGGRRGGRGGRGGCAGCGG